jgi:hypothetical protein
MTSSLDHYQREGYALIPGVLSPDQVATLRAAALHVFANEALGRGDTQSVRLDVFSRYAAFRWLWEHPPFLQALRSVFGEDFAVVSESAIHDSGFGGWHRDTESQEVHGERFHRDGDFHVGQVAIYLQDNVADYGGGIDVVPRAHHEHDSRLAIWKLKAHLLYHQRCPPLIKSAVRKIHDFGPRPIDEASFERRKLSIPSKAGDVVIFDLRIPHKASHPRITPVPETHRKLALFVVCGRNNRGTRLYRGYIGSRIDYGYLHGHVQPAAMRELAGTHGFSLL